MASESRSARATSKLTTAEASKESTKLYPDLENANSALYKELWARHHLYKVSKPRVFDNPEWLAKECASDLGITPKK
jgi:hypothetical protein